MDSDTTRTGLPAWLADRLYRLPPTHLRSKPWPEWSRREREQWQPDGVVWDRDGQRWTS